ncbi:sensor histidine kinase [Dactylosporangium sp. McL0621]|uniref:sensor histidine kinase n=1 Tax=Dactylosporangium sp. McL0621 TaxID=3415678 RepID=UPI003CEB075A
MAGIPPRLRPPAWLQDLLLALFVAYFQVRGTLLVGVEPADIPCLLLLAGTGLALAVRRRNPRAVFAALALASAGYYLAGYPDGPGWVSLFIAAYTVTNLGDGRRSVAVVGGASCVLTILWLATADLSPLNAAGWVFFRIGGIVMAAALGESVRSRRLIAEEAVARAERAEQTREAEARQRVDAERLRIAREVHDTVAHALAVINVHAGVTAHLLATHPEQVRGTLATIEQTSAQALRELRSTLGVLRADEPRTPPPGLGELERLAALGRDAGLGVVVDVGGGVRSLPSPVDHAAYRIVQESLTNAIRHAPAARVTIRVRYDDERLRLTVTDDGRGRTGAASGGRGVRGMHERAALLGGRVEAGPAPHGGFEVYAELPVRSAVEPGIAPHGDFEIPAELPVPHSDFEVHAELPVPPAVETVAVEVDPDPHGGIETRAELPGSPGACGGFEVRGGRPGAPAPVVAVVEA